MSTAAVTSSAVQGKRESVSERFPPFDDSVSLRLTPTPSVNYRCPVSTPANFVQVSGKVRRTKPLHDLFRSTQTSGPGNARVRIQRSKLTALSKASRHQKSVPRAGQGIDYYFVDPQENRREEEITNSHWLKALCAQPVDEILSKYRRHTDQHRAHLSMVRSCSTPGEKSLANAWDSNVYRSFHSAAGSAAPIERRYQAGRQMMKSAAAVEGKINSPLTTENNSENRAVKSEPSLSRLRQNVDSVERYGLSPRTAVKGRSKHSMTNHKSDYNKDNAKDGPPQRVKGFLLDEASGEEQSKGTIPSPPRYVSFTTQLFRQTDEKGNARTYSKITRGPEYLPYISNCKRVNNIAKSSQVCDSKPARPTLAEDHSPPTVDKSPHCEPEQGSKKVAKEPSAITSASEGDFEMASGSEVNKATVSSSSSQL